MPTKNCFLLTTSYRDLDGRLEITLHAATEEGKPLVAVIDNFRPVFFVSRATPTGVTRGCAERKSLPLRTMNGEDVDCLYFATQTAARTTAERLRQAGVRTFEADVSPVLRYLMERQVRGGFTCEGAIEERCGRYVVRNPQIRGVIADVRLRVLSLDIETNVATGEIYSIACTGTSDQVFVRARIAPRRSLTPCTDEREMLRRFLSHVAEQDPDILIGWNVIDFDLRVLDERCRTLGVPFAIGRGAVGRVQKSERPGVRYNARVPGRVVMDVPTMLRMYNYIFEEYSLDFVAGAMLGRGKRISERGAAKIEEIDRQFREDPVSLARYNLQDARLTLQIFERAGILQNAIERSRRSGHLLDRTGGSVAAFDYLYLPVLHRRGYVAANAADVSVPDHGLSGGFVMDPRPGIYENVVVLDFRSLYPSIIMTFLVDPLGLAIPSADRIRNPAGTSFAREAALLPGIIKELMEARAEAKRTRNPYLSQAIKIIMNSFYGVLGTPACRFFSVDLAQTITQTGQYVFKQTVAHIESSTPYRVIYGDTDSVFVLLGPGHEQEGEVEGRRIAAATTAWLAKHVREQFAAESALELQFEAHYRHFLIPSVRGGQEGSKKHYCGGRMTPQGLELTFKGMESARSDWTELAKEFQRELCRRLFERRAVDDYVRQTVKAVRAGMLDDKLIYRKRLRKGIAEYTENVPPHVQAARMLENAEGVIRYVITTQGPQPVEKRTAPLDYEHYVEAQLRPVADSVLEFVNLTFDRLVSGQQNLFE